MGKYGEKIEQKTKRIPPRPTQTKPFVLKFKLVFLLSLLIIMW
jgi:hypothetical protein